MEYFYLSRAGKGFAASVRRRRNGKNPTYAKMHVFFAVIRLYVGERHNRVHLQTDAKFSP